MPAGEELLAAGSARRRLSASLRRSRSEAIRGEYAGRFPRAVCGGVLVAGAASSTFFTISSNALSRLLDIERSPHEVGSSSMGDASSDEDVDPEAATDKWREACAEVSVGRHVSWVGLAGPLGTRCRGPLTLRVERSRCGTRGTTVCSSPGMAWVAKKLPADADAGKAMLAVRRDPSMGKAVIMPDEDDDAASVIPPAPTL